ncbi:response regulator [Patescibacteria group bacterium]|nr:response regulator [Patescibacteria group bacterium]
MATSKQKNKRILLVEDHPDIVAMYKVIFEIKVKAELSVAEDKESGLKMLKDKKPDLLLLDIVIPEKKTHGLQPTARHGFELLKELRQDKDGKDIPVIVLTNLESTRDRREAQDYGAVDYIVKSRTLPNEVADRVNEALEKE